MRQQSSSDERVRPVDTDEPPRRGRRLRVVPALVVAALVLAALIVVQYFDSADERSREDAIRVSERFIEAHNLRDHETARSLVADTAVISMNPARSVDELEMEMAWLEATGWVITSNGCRATSGLSEEDPIHVLCSLTHENAWSRVMGLEPNTRGSLTVDVASGEITAAIYSSAPMSFPGESEVAFVSWVAQAHPGDLGPMFRYIGLPSLTSESIELWSRNTDEFVEAQRG